MNFIRFLSAGLFTCLSVAAAEQQLNTFSPNTIADPAKVNENFEILLNITKNKQRLGNPVAVNCDSDSLAMLTAISSGASFIEITSGECLANTGPVSDEIPILGDLYIRGASNAGATLNTIVGDGTGQEATYFGGRTGNIILENVSVSGGIVLISSAASLLLLDSTISCSANSIGAYLNGGSGSLVRSSISDCDISIVADTNAVLNMKQSVITKPKPSVDYYPLGVVLRQGASGVLAESEINSQLADGGLGISLAASVQASDLKLVETRSSGMISATRFSTIIIENDLTNDVPDVVFAPGVGQSSNVIQLSEGSSVYARNIQFSNTSITSNGFDNSTSVFLEGLDGLTHSNLSVNAGSEIVLNGPWEGTNLSARIGESGIISVRNAGEYFGTPWTSQNQFSFVAALGVNSLLHASSTADIDNWPTDFATSNFCRWGYDNHDIIYAVLSPQEGLLACSAPEPDPET